MMSVTTYYFFTPCWDAPPPPASMAYRYTLESKHRVFNSSSTVDDIVVAGENALVSLYGGKLGEKLDGMRYQRYCEKLSTNSSQILTRNLPPTTGAA